MAREHDILTSRRALLGLAAAGLAGTVPLARARAARVATKARIVIVGAGAAGTAMASRLVERLDGAAITLVDGRAAHWYQPGFSLVAAGLRPASYTVSRTTDWLPQGVTLVPEAAAGIDPVAKTVTTAGGKRLAYDFLIVAPGLVLDYAAIEGFSLDLIGRDGIGSLYAGPDYAAKTWAAASAFADTGGKGVFTRPGTEMKCAGAPLKHTFLIEDIASRRVGKGRYEITYAANNTALFSVPIVSEKVRMLFEERGIAAVYSHVLKAVDPGRRIATFATPKGDTQMAYDYLHVIPPQRAPEVIRQSGLSWADRWTDQGWVEADQKTLRHRRFPEVFAIGDVAGVPKGKTAASVKWQVPVVEDHLVAQIEGRQGTAVYDGYTSCPLITRVGRAMLIEFDYHNNLTPSFPGVIAPLEELWISWLMKEVALKATYSAMLRGRA
ncbi:FAD/NAD(P)-binding oxidoreductase [Rhodoplanes sp. TEM]|uniref:FAD/NAD(P)-binding oxidoreductase n=1 Tax=Rhodoplanes tepidamans TaxID=200616 RepID=A0ABT5JK59_RHOTP|nr:MULTISPECIES: FAD/NAD(P)-binding oxidoreductase [Rhodoplanes]MDC7789937.1 FAD/NAD(P)-binding oxidoreductase [Rhodoplanes tepidamans]MDC7987850.1 FAD/NAD(P)-binding oxidoreductase [Rhodoplanes sp. TEM]MDQ0357849.1 sulfide:quinone oxidoreductase [Rhodoplanes tepidamans]